ncbi:fringe-like protein (DUF604) [Rhynchospora pubera]|uniref:Fringe-like protein (DUF604) n=1 Tax=Rhynchospora pubera TaxID=906938 RepID=A0AAV8E0Z4_9POAL|nr:fringe-like protein (DUF604) [Rhynchospora pubera]
MKGGGDKEVHQMSPNFKKGSLVWGIWPHNSRPSSSYNRSLLFSRLMFSVVLPVCIVFYIMYSLNLVFFSWGLPPCPTSGLDDDMPISRLLSSDNISANSAPEKSRPTSSLKSPDYTPTGLQHIVFGIAASASLWEKRREYIKIWWRPGKMRGYVWLDKPVKEFRYRSTSTGLPALKISGDTSKFPYTHKKGSRSAIRISRIVSETFRLDLPDVRWFVMGDDDTVFIPDNLVRVLSKFDHRQPYYIGSHSESHLQNIYFSYGMAYGGGGFAISRPLAAAIAKMQDGCIKRYPALYGSDDRIQACMAELGVPLTRHPGFHQYDVYGDLLGLLAAHPVAPLVSLHHLDVVQPIFPSMTRAAAVKKLFAGPVRFDSAGVIQQSICYDTTNRWTVSVSWGFAVQIVRGVMSPREMETPTRTFLNWYRRADYTAYAFNTRPVARNPCQKPHVYYLSATRLNITKRAIVTEYKKHKEKHQSCRWKDNNPADMVDQVLVLKKPDPGLWDRAPRKNCCKVLSAPRDGEKGNRVLTIEVSVCREGEMSQI